MKIGDHIYIHGEKIDTPVIRTLIKGGEADVEEILNETETTITCLVYFTDDRYENSVQRLFYKNDLPQTLTKERIMATRKKKAAKKTSTKKAAKKATKKVAKKSAAKKEGVVPLSRFISSMIVEGKLTDVKMAEKTQSAYPKYKHAGLKAIDYYRKFINDGKMEKAGFPKPKKPYQPMGKRPDLEKKTVERKPANKKSAKRKVASRRK